MTLKSGKARGSERKLSEEELAKEQEKLDELLASREEERSRAIIEPVNAHTTACVGRLENNLGGKMDQIVNIIGGQFKASSTSTSTSVDGNGEAGAESYEEAHNEDCDK